MQFSEEFHKNKLIICSKKGSIDFCHFSNKNTSSHKCPLSSDNGSRWGGNAGLSQMPVLLSSPLSMIFHTVHSLMLSVFPSPRSSDGMGCAGVSCETRRLCFSSAGVLPSPAASCLGQFTTCLCVNAVLTVRFHYKP